MRPFIHVNCAMSADGKIAGVERRQMRISSDEDMIRVKDLRRKCDCILVGVGTVVSDDPHLTVKGLSRDENPVRIVLDPNGRTPDDARVADGCARTMIVTSDRCTKEWTGVETMRSEGMDLQSIVERLGDLGLKYLLVEGGGETISSFFKERLVDLYTVFVGSMIIGGRTAPTPVDGQVSMDLPVRLMEAAVLGKGVLLTYKVTSPTQ